MRAAMGGVGRTSVRTRLVTGVMGRAWPRRAADVQKLAFSGAVGADVSDLLGSAAMTPNLPRELVESLVCPETREPVAAASDAELEALRRAFSEGRARRRDGGELPATVEGAFLTADRRHAYLVVDGVPSFLVEERVELDQPLDAAT